MSSLLHSYMGVLHAEYTCGATAEAKEAARSILQSIVYKEAQCAQVFNERIDAELQRQRKWINTGKLLLQQLVQLLPKA